MEQKGICYIVGAGELFGRIPDPRQEDLVIAADGGYAYLQRLKIPADIVMGDFDSLDGRPDHPCVVEYSCVKDDTDMLAAIKRGLETGYREFWLYGGMGGRLDHTLANLQCLSYLSHKGAKGTLFGDGIAVTAVTDGTVKFGEEYEGYISVFSLSDRSEGVNLKGLKYELEDALLDNQFPLGVSNEFLGVRSLVSVRKGTLLILYTLKA